MIIFNLSVPTFGYWECKMKPQFYPLSYKVRANQLLKDKLHMKREQITIENMENVYNILVSNI